MHWYVICLIAVVRNKRGDFLDVFPQRCFPVVSPCDPGYERWSQKTTVPRLPDAEVHMMLCSSSSRMCVLNHNWSATKQRPHPQSVAEISRHSVLSGDRIQQWDIVWVSPQGHRSVSVSRQPCSVRKQFSRDHCCRGRSNANAMFISYDTLSACVRQTSHLQQTCFLAWLNATKIIINI